MGVMVKDEVDSFLESKLNVQLATIDEMGDPNLHPLWFYYDRNPKETASRSFQRSTKVIHVGLWQNALVTCAFACFP